MRSRFGHVEQLLLLSLLQLVNLLWLVGNVEELVVDLLHLLLEAQRAGLSALFHLFDVLVETVHFGDLLLDSNELSPAFCTFSVILQLHQGLDWRDLVQF